VTAVDPRPSDTFRFSAGRGEVLVIACGALAREIVTLIELNHWTALDLRCLPAKWHNTPDKITPALRAAIREEKGKYRKILVAYGDCGTGGRLDTMLAEEGVERIVGPHCYSFFSGTEAFAARLDDEATVFYLTDYLARHFDRLVWQGLGLDRHPELLPDYFGNYSRLVYLAQTKDDGLAQLAEAAAARLGLAYEYRFTGYGDLARFMAAPVKD
jgi:hypothetical protein